jgi:hypothetical protein
MSIPLKVAKQVDGILRHYWGNVHQLHSLESRTDHHG